MAKLESYYNTVNKQTSQAKADAVSIMTSHKADIEQQVDTITSELEADLSKKLKSAGATEKEIQDEINRLRKLETKSKRNQSLIGYDRGSVLDFTKEIADLTQQSENAAIDFTGYSQAVKKAVIDTEVSGQESIAELGQSIESYINKVQSEANIEKAETTDDFNNNYVELNTGEVISKADYDALGNADKVKIKELGLARFESYKTKELSDRYITLESGDTVDKNTFITLSQADQDYINKNGVDAYNEYIQSGDYQFKAMQASGEIPMGVEYVGYDASTGLINYTGVDIRTAGQIDTEMESAGNHKLDTGEWIPLEDTTSEDGTVYTGFNSLTPEQQAYMQANGVEAFNTWNNTKHDVAIAKAQADYAKAMQEYINNPNTQTLYNLTQMQTELARIQNEGYYTFKTMQASGEIPADAIYIDYDTATGNINYQVPDSRTGEQIFAAMQASGEIPTDATFISYDSTTGDINYQLATTDSDTVVNIPDKYKVDDTHYDLVEYLYDNPNGEQALLDAGFTAEDIAASKNTLNDYQANYKRLDTGEWIPLNSYTDEDGGTVLGYNDMTPQDQDYINRMGVDKYNSLMNRMNETRNEALSQLDKYKITNEDGSVGYDLVEYFIDGGELGLLTKAGFTPEDWNESFFTASDYKNNYKRLDNGDWIPLNDTVGDDGIKYAGFNSLTPEQQAYMQANGVEAFNNWLDSQSVSVVEVTKADGTTETIEQSEWDAKSELQQYEYYLGREPTLSEWQGYRLQQLIDSGAVSETNVKVYYGLVGIGQASGLVSTLIGGTDTKAEAIYKTNLAAQTEWQREYPDQMWTGAFINSLEDLGFPAAKAFYNQITVKDISGSEWAMTGLSAALWTTPAWLPKIVKGVKGTVKTVKAIKTTVAKTVAKPITKITTNISNRANILQSDILTGSYNVASKAATALKSTAIAKVATKAISKIPKISSVTNIRATNLTSATRGITSTTVEKLNEAIAKLGANITSGTKATVLKSADELIDIANKLKTSDVNLILKGKGITVTEAKSITKLANSLKREAGYIKAFKGEILESRQLPKLKGVYDDIIELTNKSRTTESISLDTAEAVLEVTPKAEAISQIRNYLKLNELRGFKDVKSSVFSDTITAKGWGKYNIDEYAERLYDAIGKQINTSGYASAIELYGDDLVKAYSPKALEYAASERLFAQQRALSSIAIDTKGKHIFESMVETTKPKTTSATSLADDIANEKLLDDIWEQVENYATEQRSKGFTVTRDDMYLMVKDAYEKARIGSSAIETLGIPEQSILRLTPLEEAKYLGKSLEVPKVDSIAKPINTTSIKSGQSILDTVSTKPFTGVGIPSIPININALANANVSIVNQQVLNTITPAQLSGIEQLTARQVEAIAETYGLTTEQVRIAQKEGTLKTTIQNVVNTQTQSVTQTQGVILTNANIDALSTINMDNTIKASIEAPYEVTETITQPIEVPARKPVTIDETITQPIEVPARKPVTIDETIPKPITRTITNVKVTEIKTGKIKILKVISMDDEEKEEIKEGTKELPIGSVIWRQGKFWKALIPPYKTGDLLNLKQQPMNYSKYSTGEGSAYRTVGVVGGVMPEQIDIDYGVMDIKIARGLNKDVYMDFDNKGLDTDIGKSKKSKTKGITVRDKRVKNLNGYPDLPDRYYLNHKLPDAGLIVNI